MSGALNGLQERLRQLHEQWAQFPGRAPNGTGLTGLASNDSLGYSKMLNEQTEGLNIEREMNGQAPLNVRYGGEFASQNHGIADNPTTPYAQQLASLRRPQPAIVTPKEETPEEFMAKQRAQYEKNYAADQAKKRR